MMADFHFLRPFWFLAILPLLGLVFVLWRQTPQLHAWGEICDSHLLSHLLQSKGQRKRMSSLLFLLGSTLLMVVSIAGPTWQKLPVPTYKPIQPRVILLDMSDNMMVSDLSPNRLSRAKFKLHDLLSQKGLGQFGMIVYTSEPYVVSPLTDDGQTIVSLLSMLTPDIMPVTGQKLDNAIQEGRQLIKQAGYTNGQLLVMTASTPSAEAIQVAKQMAAEGIQVSVMPITAENNLNPLFGRFAEAGQGQLLKYTADSDDFKPWLNQKVREEFVLSKEDDVPLWRDDGRWFLIPALLLLLPSFQRGWLQKVAV